MYLKRAQTLIEYVILTSVVIAVIVVCSGTFFNQLTGDGAPAKNFKPSPQGSFYKHFQNMNERMEGVNAVGAGG